MESINQDNQVIYKYSIKKLLPFIIIIISSIVGLWILSPIFKSGIPMNIDLPFHYGRISCFEKSEFWSLPSMWCPYGQAGIASFQAYALVPFYLMMIFNWLLPLEVAFKIVLIIVYFLLPIGGFLLLYKRGHALSGAFAFVFLLFEHGSWHSGGFDKIFYVGLFSNAMGSAMILISFAFAFDLFTKPSVKNLIKLTIVSSLLFLSHAATFMFFPIILLIIAFFYYQNVKKNLRLFIAYPILVFLIVSFWLIPFLAKQDYYVKSGGGNVKFNEINVYLFSTLSLWIIILGFIGIIIMFFTKKTDFFVIGIVTLSIPLLWIIGFIWPSFPFFKYIQMIRNLAEFRSFLIISAALLLGLLSNIFILLWKKRISLLPVSLFIFLIIAIYLSQGLSQQSNIIILSNLPEFKQIEEIYELLNNTQGRIIVEDTLFGAGQNALSFSHPFALSPALTNLELIGTGDNLYNTFDFSNTQQGNLLEKHISQYSNDEINNLFNDLNIEYVVAFTPQYIQKFKNWQLYKNIGIWHIFKTPINTSYFEIKDGLIKSSEYRRTSARVLVEAEKDTKLLFKIRAFPNWIISLDGKKISYEISSRGLIIVNVPKGSHEILFNYRMINIDYIGYLLSLVGLFFLILIWKRKIFK